MKIKVGILGCTGVLGQTYVELLRDHPWFEIAFLAASQDSCGKKYHEAVRGKWHQHSPLPQAVGEHLVYSIDDIDEARRECALIFSAISSELAAHYESLYAAAGLKVISSASHHRLDRDIPLLIPEINPEHLLAIPEQQKLRGFKDGFIVTKPNCSIQSYMLPLFAVHREFRVTQLAVTTLQAISGAGFPGLSALHIQDNIVPFIAGEEEKSEQEPLKILGRVEKGLIIPSQGMRISAHCNRVPVMDGHMACLSVKCATRPDLQTILKLWRGFQGERTPSAPVQPIQYFEEENRPQPRLDRMHSKGMGVSVGRLRECPLFDFRFCALSHNTIRGGAGGGILIAELLVEKKYI